MLYEAEESIILYGFSGQSWKKIGQIVQREFQEKRERERDNASRFVGKNRGDVFKS